MKKSEFKTLSVRFSPEIRAAVEQAARDDSRPAAVLVELVMIQYLKDRGYLPKAGAKATAK